MLLFPLSAFQLSPDFNWFPLCLRFVSWCHGWSNAQATTKRPVFHYRKRFDLPAWQPARVKMARRAVSVRNHTTLGGAPRSTLQLFVVRILSNDGEIVVLAYSQITASSLPQATIVDMSRTGIPSCTAPTKDGGRFSSKTAVSPYGNRYHRSRSAA